MAGGSPMAALGSPAKGGRGIAAQSAKGWRRSAGLAAGTAILVLLLGHNRHLRQTTTVAGRAALVLATYEQRPLSLIVGMTHHKTGTTQMGCLLYNWAYEAGLATPDYKDNGADTPDIEAYHTSTDPLARPAAFLTGHKLARHCYTRNSTGCWSGCPHQYPCSASMAPVLELGNCYMQIPGGAHTGFLHFVRNPLSLVVSAYLYHTQQPPPEDWIWKFNANTYAGQLQSISGVPAVQLEQYNMTSSGSNASYGDVLRSLPVRKGIKLEFWRSAPELFAMAWQYQQLQSQPSAHQVRFEDLHQAFNSTALGIARALYRAQDPQQLVDRAHREGCDPTTWSAEQLAQHSHVTFAKEEAVPKQQLADWLMEDAQIRAHLCTISAALEYSEPRCSTDAAAAAAAEAARSEQL